MKECAGVRHTRECESARKTVSVVGSTRIEKQSRRKMRRTKQQCKRVKAKEERSEAKQKRKKQQQQQQQHRTTSASVRRHAGTQQSVGTGMQQAQVQVQGLEEREKDGGALSHLAASFAR